MKKFLKLTAILFLVFTLTGCGDDSGGGGGDMDMNSLMGGGGDMDMGALMGGGGDMDMSALMGGGGLDMSMLMGGDDDGGEGDGGSSSNGPPPPMYVDKGDVFITHNNRQYFLKAVATNREDIVMPTTQMNRDESYTIQIAGYDTRNNVVNVDSGHLVFTFTIPTLTTTGGFELSTPEHKSGHIVITVAKMQDDNTLRLKGYTDNVEIYSMDKSTTFKIAIEFDVDVAVLAQ